jgi:hypothetical protein
VFDCTAALAYTYVPHRTANPPKEYPSQIQVCPWFLEYGMGKSNQFQGQFSPSMKSQLATKLDEVVTKVVFTPIDLAALFDKVIVHEVGITN